MVCEGGHSSDVVLFGRVKHSQMMFQNAIHQVKARLAEYNPNFFNFACGATFTART